MRSVSSSTSSTPIAALRAAARAAPPASRRPTIAARPRTPQSAAARRRPSAAAGRRARATAGAMPRARRRAPTARPQPSSSAFSASDDREEVAAAVADGAEQRQLAPPLEHVAQQHRREPDRAEQQPEAAERLERREVGVLDAWNSASRSTVGTASAPRSPAALLDRGGDRGRPLGRRLDQQEPVALLLGKQRAGSCASDISSSPWKMLSAQRGDEAQPDRPAAAVDDDVVAERSCAARRSSSWRRRSTGTDAVAASARSSSSHGLARSASVVASEPWNAKRPASMNAGATPRMRGLRRLVQVQAARIVAGQDAERFDRDVVAAASRPERLAAVAAVRDRGRAAAADRRAARSRRCRTADRSSTAPSGGTRRRRSG